MSATSANAEARAGPRRAPIALYAGFGVFLVVIVLLVVSSVSRRDVPAFEVSSAARIRAPDWERDGDTLTLDAADDGRWRLASFSRGSALAPGDTTDWTIGVTRYRVMVNGSVADAGRVAFGSLTAPWHGTFMRAESPSDSTNAALRHWYRYDFLTHLLEPDGHVFVLLDARNRLWKLEIVSYYCPGPRAGCLTIHYAPM